MASHAVQDHRVDVVIAKFVVNQLGEVVAADWEERTWMDTRQHESNLFRRGREDYPCSDGLVLGILREKVLEAGGLVRDPRLEEGLEGLQRVDANAFGLEGLEFQEEASGDSQHHEAE